MLKISREQGLGGRAVLKLEGTLGGAWVRELKAVCDSAFGKQGEITLDLAAIAYVDRAGLELLEALRSDPRVEIARVSAFVAEMLKRGAA